ncbi:MAG: energy transducer TonB [Bacteroidota bacterium]
MNKNKLSIILAMLCITLFTYNYTFSQVVNDNNDQPFTVVEVMPQFAGGNDSLSSFLSNNLKYPILAREDGTQGTVYVTFVVTKNGNVSSIKILRGIGSGCDEEVIRVLKLMPKWKPGKQNGENVNVQFNLPIKFTLPEDNIEIKEKKK